MNPGEMEKLLGGYATDTLTDRERSELFTAALGNQALFDALADEQALRELLLDPASRAQLLAALGEPRQSLLARMSAWLLRPSGLALAGAIAAGIMLIAVVRPGKLRQERPPAVAMTQPRVSAPETPQPLAKQEPPPDTRQPAPAQPPSETVSPKPAGAKKTAGEEARREERTFMAQNAPPPAKSMGPAPPPQAAPSLPPPPPPAQIVPAPSAALPHLAPAPVQRQSQLADQQQAPAATQSKEADAAQQQAGGARPEYNKAGNLANARDLYYAAPRSAISGFGGSVRAKRAAPSRSFPGNVAGSAAGKALYAGVRYSLLKSGPDDTFAEVDPTAALAPGAAIRLRFEANQAGNLRVIERQGDNWIERLATSIRPGAPVYFPSDGALTVAAAGGLHFFVKFSPASHPDVSIEPVAATPDLLREQVANSVYLVNAKTMPDATVDFELAINVSVAR